MGKAAGGEDLVGADAVLFQRVAVDDVVEAARAGVGEAGEEGGGGAGGGFGPAGAAGPGSGDAERVDPEGLDFDGLSDAGGDDPVADLGVHPGELLPGGAGVEEAVLGGGNAVAGAGGVALEDGYAGGLEFLRRAGAGGGEEEVVDGDDEPEAGVDGVVFGGAGAVGEAVGEHALVDVRGPGEEDGLGEVTAGGGLGGGGA